MEQSESLQKREQAPLFTSGKSVFKGKRTYSNHFGGCNSVKRLKDMLSVERNVNHTPPIQPELRTPLIRVNSESKFYCNETYHGKQSTSCNSEDQNNSKMKPQIFLEVPQSREREIKSRDSKKRKIALIYENSAIRGIQKLNRKKLPHVKNELRQIKFRQTPELSNKSASSRSLSPSIQLLQPVNRNYKRIDYLRASIGNCEQKTESFLSSISFKSPMKYRANQSIGGSETFEKSSRQNRLVIKKAQITSKRQKLINLYRGDQPRSRNELSYQNESVRLSAKLRGKPLLDIFQDQDIKRNTPTQLNLDLPITPRDPSTMRKESRAESDFSRKEQSMIEGRSGIEGQESSQSESFAILRPAISAFQNKPENSRNHEKKMSQFKKSGHSRQRALFQDDFKKISSSFMQPSSRSRAVLELGSKSTDIATRHRQKIEDTLYFPRINLNPGSSNDENFSLEQMTEDQAKKEMEGDMSDYEIGTFRITDETPSVLKIIRHSHITEGSQGMEKQSVVNQENSTERGHEKGNEHDNVEGGEEFGNLDAQDISIRAMRNEEELEDDCKNESFYFSNRNQELFGSEKSEKKDSGNSLWNADNLLDDQAPQEAPPHNLSSFMIMEMLKKNKEKQKRHKLIRNISNADTEEFRSHRSISEIFEAAQEEEDGFLCDESDAFVRRFNTTGGELSQAIQDLVQRSNYTSAKV